MTESLIQPSPNTPEQDAPKLQRVYDAIHQAGGLVFRSWDVPASETYDHAQDLELFNAAQPLTVTVGIISANEYDSFWRQKVIAAERETVWGEEIHYLERALARGTGETGASATGVAVRELHVAESAFTRWNQIMLSSGKYAMWGMQRQPDGYGAFRPRDLKAGPWTLSVADASGVVFSHTYDGLSNIEISK